MNLGGPLVEVAAYPRVVDERPRRRLDLDVAIDAAPAMHRAHQSLAGRTHVVHLRYNRSVRAGRDEIGHFVFVRPAIAVHERDLLPVHPEPSARLHAADLQPDALAGPGRRDRDRLAVPAVAHVLVADRLGVVVPHRIPALGLSRFAHALRLPASRDAYLARIRPIRIAVEMLPHPVPPRHRHGLGKKLPFAAKREHAT